MKQEKYRFYIGIDPGRTTGLAIWDSGKKAFITIEGLTAFEAMRRVYNMSIADVFNDQGLIVIVEDARQRKWYGKDASQKLKGAGAIEARCWDWEDMLKAHYIDHEFIHPIKGGTKIKASPFKKLTGYTPQTNEHGRDAAMLVFQK